VKLYTKPRPVLASTVRVGDELALALNGTTPMPGLAELVDAELAEEVAWGAVHTVVLQTTRSHSRAAIATNLGRVDVQDADETVIVREYVELDPWSYVRHA
jgi:hypothetical protein